jgi:hypothetical protein
VPRRFLLPFFVLLWSAACITSVKADGLARGKYRFYYKTTSGSVSSARIIHQYYGPTVHPTALIDPRLDPKLQRAATIAQERANARTKARCWRYVKEALLEAGVINSYPKSNYACDAGDELVRSYGFKRLSIRDPYAAPIGAVIVYSRGSAGAGHVELRTRDGFVSDYHSKTKCFYPLLAVYGKFTS